MGSFKHEFLLKKVGIDEAVVGGVVQSIFQLPDYKYKGYYLSYCVTKEDGEFGQVKFEVDLEKQTTQLKEVYRLPTEETDGIDEIKEFEKQLLETLTEEEKEERPKLVYCSFETESQTENKHTTTWLVDTPTDLYVDGGIFFEKNEKFRKALITKFTKDIPLDEPNTLQSLLKCFDGFKVIMCFHNEENFPTKGIFLVKTSKIKDFLKDLSTKEEERNEFIDMEKLKTAAEVLYKKAVTEESYQDEDFVLWGLQFGGQNINSQDSLCSLVPVKLIFAPTKDPLYKFTLGDSESSKK